EQIAQRVQGYYRHVESSLYLRYPAQAVLAQLVGPGFRHMAIDRVVELLLLRSQLRVGLALPAIDDVRGVDHIAVENAGYGALRHAVIQYQLVPLLEHRGFLEDRTRPAGEIGPHSQELTALDSGSAGQHGV